MLCIRYYSRSWRNRGGQKKEKQKKLNPARKRVPAIKNQDPRPKTKNQILQAEFPNFCSKLRIKISSRTPSIRPPLGKTPSHQKLRPPQHF